MKNWGLVILLGITVFGAVFGLRNISNRKSEKSKIAGVILPHHALAKVLFHSSFRRLKEQISPRTIVILGTNHYFPISETFTTTNEVNNEYELDKVLSDDDRIKKEHSIQTLLPYIREYFPNSRVIPIIISTKYDFGDLSKQAEIFIEKFGNENLLYIASVDFAHNVSLEEGLSKNKESINSISSFNYNEILKYQDDHMDSPVAISTLLLIMQEISAKSWETWYSSHGALITNDLNLNGTSYVIGSFSKGEQ